MSHALKTPPRSRALALPSPAGSIEAYLQAVNAVPLLDETAERVLAERYRAQADLGAAQQLVLANLRFVVHIARGYQGYGLALADLVQEGNVGLMKAVKRFDPAVGVRLVSFAVHWIRAEIHEYILKNWRIVKVATTKAQRKLFFNLRGYKQRLGWLKGDEVQAVARDLGVEPREVLEMEKRLNAHDLAFDAPADAEDDEAHAAPVHHLEDQRYDPARVVEEEDYEAHSHERLHGALERLDTRSRDILARRFLGDGKTTLHDLAAEYGVSAERIRQIEANALKKLRGALSA
jgi:RNA polymerase sigma-32 factor